MDIKCHKCGEPWDMDSLHEMGEWIGEELSFNQARRRFYADGCTAFGTGHGTMDYANGSIVAELADLLGDDIDGFAAMLEDLGL